MSNVNKKRGRCERLRSLNGDISMDTDKRAGESKRELRAYWKKWDSMRGIIPSFRLNQANGFEDEAA
ncbi:hypothetical protein EDM53_04780 [Rickettsiales endosymbiont of Peranema trichophorum]|uniref:hypothetical protein n=1 Tax=Rickettsiales endosymbiont of Peranema trichophorum TaxID=2486577 RepID=UPI001023408D|nr:hypothetical protein [Rickettsiales endosymbiont of Peranema trichophorum]RZI45619.1 hypothetical protein EDM53_04780 [Rickettsiales endosymbiont of Peranema trichophorum]